MIRPTDLFVERIRMRDYKRILLLVIVFFYGSVLEAAILYNMKSYRIENDFVPDGDGTKAVWMQALSHQTIISDWQGKTTYPMLKTTVKSLWSDHYIYFIYIASFEELTLDPSIKPDENGDCWEIWNSDVVEIFIGDGPDRKRYKEFVISPIDQKIDIRHNKNLEQGKSSDPAWDSGWEAAVSVDRKTKVWVTEFRIPLEKLSTTLSVEDKKFHFNVFRCEGAGADRKYLSMNATLTSKPSFHVPERFGELTLVLGSPKLPAPVVSLTFEDIDSPLIIPDKGLAQSRGFDLVGKKKGLVLNDTRIKECLNGSISITVTGWFRDKINLDDLDNQCLLSVPGRFKLISRGIYKGRMGLYLTTQSADPKEISVWSSWSSPFLAEDKWVFFAFTYDGQKEEGNGAVYVGGETIPIRLDQMVSIASGRLAQSENDALIVGALSDAGGDSFKGVLDNIRIYSESLSFEQIEQVRKSDMGQQRLDALNAEQAQKELEKKNFQAAVVQKYWSENFNAARVDSLDWVFPDRAPQSAKGNESLSVPRGGKVAIQIALMSQSNGLCRFDVSSFVDAQGNTLKCQVKTYKLLDVLVEANRGGCGRTSVAIDPPGLWKDYFTRQAPFRVYDPAFESDRLKLEAGRYRPMLIEVTVDADAVAGLYQGHANFTTQSLPEDDACCGGKYPKGYQKQSVPLEIQVHKTVTPENYILHSTHWLSVKPENLTRLQPLEWWSEGHWAQLENSGRILRQFGQDTMYTPLVDGSHPLIRTIRKEDGSLDFDYRRFDRWFKMYLDMGFVNFDGHQIAGGHHALPMEVYVFEGNDKERLFSKGDKDSVERWFDFIPVFYQSLYTHLKQNNWCQYYSQYQLDEPKQRESYKRLYELAQKYMPGIKTKDAINGSPEYYSPLVDVHVFSISSLATQKEVALEREKRGKETWMYHCCSPYPPYPNRGLDEALTSSRFYPWCAYPLNATGFLHWAANVYRGADPYKTSVGPVPSGSQNPGHPPGDNWLFYPGSTGLVPSLRMFAFRDGLLDHTLLMMLAERDPAKADQVMARIARSLVDFQRDPESYHKARKELLNALDERD